MSGKRMAAAVIGGVVLWSALWVGGTMLVPAILSGSRFASQPHMAH